MKYLNKKANVVAAVVVIVVVIALGVILMNVSVNKEPGVDEQPRVTSEAENAYMRAIEGGIQEWLQNGFSNLSEVQYCNYPTPPDLNEAKDSLKYYLEQNVNTALENLRRENEDYFIGDDIEIILPALDDINNLPSNVQIQSQNFKVGIETENLDQHDDISGDNQKDWPVWDIFTNIRTWMADDAGNMHQHMTELAFRARPCQIIRSACLCEDAEAFSEAVVNQTKINETDVKKAVDASIQELNDLFAGSNINCSYKFAPLSILHKAKVDWTASSAAQSVDDDSGPNYPILTRMIPYNDERYDGGTDDDYPNVDLGEFRIRDFSYASIPDTGCIDIGTGTNERPDVKGGAGVDNWVTDTVKYGNETQTSCTQVEAYLVANGEPNGELEQAMKVGMLAMDNYASFIIEVKCEDPDSLVEGDMGFEPLSAEFSMRYSAMQDCPLPNHPSDIMDLEGDDPVDTCPGGSCFPAGTMVALADGTEKPIEDVEIGDEVLSYDTVLESYTTGKVLMLESPIREATYIVRLSDGTAVEITNEHPIYTLKASGEMGWASIDPEATARDTNSILVIYQLEAGDNVMKKDKSWAKVISIEIIEGQIRTYNLKDVEGASNFFADDVLAHNKCCFAAGTEIIMADGTTKVIEDVMIGESVMTYNEETGEKEPAIVEVLDQPIREGLYVVTFASGVELEVTGDHPLYIMNEDGSGAWAAIDVEASIAAYRLSQTDQLDVGDSVVTETGTDEVVSIVYVEGDVQTYTLERVSKNKNFFANGVVAHNGKPVSFVGLACPKECEECLGCLYVGGPADDESSWECVPAPMLVCGNTECTVCSIGGTCTDPAPDQMRCGGGECSRCDGVNIGPSACIVNPAAALGQPCDSNPCSTCSGDLRTDDNGCLGDPVAEQACNIDSYPADQQGCMMCETRTTCAANPLKIDAKCGPCARCGANGLCDAPAPGAIDECQAGGLTCMECSDTATSCQLDMGRSKNCGTCKTCGIDGSCVADDTVDDQQEGCGICRVCSGGSCVANPASDGLNCGGTTDCPKVCNAAGSCVATNVGGNCVGQTSNPCGLPGTCSASGKCETTDMTKKCCGTAVCDSNDDCCIGLGNDKCEACPETT